MADSYTGQPSEDLAAEIAYGGGRSENISIPSRAADMTAPTLPDVTLSEDDARDISRAAKQATSWTERRNTLIRAAFERGAGIRELAKASGLNVGTVHTMLHGRKR